LSRVYARAKEDRINALRVQITFKGRTRVIDYGKLPRPRPYSQRRVLHHRAKGYLRKRASDTTKLPNLLELKFSGAWKESSQKEVKLWYELMGEKFELDSGH
jgi:hypothetical protein